MALEPIESVSALRIKGGKAERITQAVATEFWLKIELNGSRIANIACTPTSLKELTVGFLFTGGFVDSYESIESIVIEGSTAKVKVKGPEKEFEMAATPCSMGVVPVARGELKRIEEELSLEAGTIMRALKAFYTMSKNYKETRGFHSAALFHGGEPLIFEDDIGRHNAVDKVVGGSLLKGIDPGDKWLAVSGRLSSEIVRKAGTLGVPIVASKGAPTSEAVALAELINLTLVGFVRGDGMTVFTNEWRVKPT